MGQLFSNTEVSHSLKNLIAIASIRIKSRVEMDNILKSIVQNEFSVF